MTLYDLGFSDAVARNSSMISLNKGDLSRYLIFHLAQSVPAGSLLASSTNCMSLVRRSVFLGFRKTRQYMACKIPHKREMNSADEIVRGKV